MTHDRALEIAQAKADNVVRMLNTLAPYPRINRMNSLGMVNSYVDGKKISFTIGDFNGGSWNAQPKEQLLQALTALAPDGKKLTYVDEKETYPVRHDNAMVLRLTYQIPEREKRDYDTVARFATAFRAVDGQIAWPYEFTAFRDDAELARETFARAGYSFEPNNGDAVLGRFKATAEEMIKSGRKALVQKAYDYLQHKVEQSIDYSEADKYLVSSMLQEKFQPLLERAPMPAMAL